MAWAAKSGTVWHGDPACGQLKGRGKEVTLTQPTVGSLADRKLPERLHCNPPGAVAIYQATAELLMDFDHETRKAVEMLAEGRLHLSVAAAKSAVRNLERQLRDQPELLAHMKRCARERQSLLDDLEHEVHDRLPMMLAAAWVAIGRTPRQHQERYEAFIEAAEGICEKHQVSASWGLASYVNSGYLPRWLDRVADGQLPGPATAALTAAEVRRTRKFTRDTDDDFCGRLESAWTEIGDAWYRILQGIVLANPGQSVAFFEYHQPGLSMGVLRLFDSYFPCARLDTAEFDWRCGQVPTTFGLLLKEDSRRRCGLILEGERTYHFDVERCALFLRNLVISLGAPGLASTVTPRMADVRTTSGNDATGRLAKASLPAQLHGFGVGVRSRALTAQVVAPALRAADDGVELTHPEPRPHTQVTTIR